MGLLEKNQKNSSSTTLNYIFLLKPKVSKLLVPFAQYSFYAENTIAKRKRKIINAFILRYIQLTTACPTYLVTKN